MRSIPVADPSMRDWRLSHGAQFEGLKIALAASGYELADVIIEPAVGGDGPFGLQLIASASVIAASVLDAQSAKDLALAERRQTWRGSFAAVTPSATAALDALRRVQPGCLFVSSNDDLADIAALYDAASMHFLRDRHHRKELINWMRLSTSHKGYARDGLSAVAMGLGALEAWAAGLVLGPLFDGLDRVGLAKPLLSESIKNKSAAAIVVMPKPIDEDQFDTGRHFYRLWLDFERVGLKACPMSVLIDWDDTRQQLETRFGIGNDQTICAAFRVGIPNGKSNYPRARLPVGELLV